MQSGSLSETSKDSVVGGRKLVVHEFSAASSTEDGPVISFTGPDFC